MCSVCIGTILVPGAMAITNRQIDAYLSKVKNLEIIPANTYDMLFTFDGAPRFNFNPVRRYAMAVNIDNKHWTALIIDKKAYYYDPMEEGATRYPLPQNIINFARKFNLELVTNDQPDQFSGKMCGAYVVQKILDADRGLPFDHPMPRVRKLYHHLLSL